MVGTRPGKAAAWQRWLALGLLLLAASPALAQKDEDFGDGIGFYVKSGAGIDALTWTTDPANSQRVSEIVRTLDADAVLYAYGLDFAAGTMAGPLPPHLIGYTWGYIRPDGSKEGEWAVRFVPQAGTKEKLYRLQFDGPWFSLAHGGQPHRLWYLKVPGPQDAAFVFRFGDPAEAAAEKARQRVELEASLSAADRAYDGTLSVRALGIFDAQSAAFKIRFTRFDSGSGEIEAEVSGLSGPEKYTMAGRLQGAHLMLKQDKLGTSWDIDVSGAPRLKGTQQAGMSAGEVTIDLGSYSTAGAESAPGGTPTPTPAPGGSDFAKAILGGWKGEKYVTTYCEDGTYSMSPLVPESGPTLPGGTWKIEGTTFTKTYADKPTTIYTILAITPDKLTIKDNEGNVYTQGRWK